MSRSLVVEPPWFRKRLVAACDGVVVRCRADVDLDSVHAEWDWIDGTRWDLAYHDDLEHASWSLVSNRAVFAGTLSALRGLAPSIDWRHSDDESLRYRIVNHIGWSHRSIFYDGAGRQLAEYRFGWPWQRTSATFPDEPYLGELVFAHLVPHFVPAAEGTC